MKPAGGVEDVQVAAQQPSFYFFCKRYRPMVRTDAASNFVRQRRIQKTRCERQAQVKHAPRAKGFGPLDNGVPIQIRM